ncbi:hypothetical protein NPIL_435091 [Nephila pilipes]|uniref:Uncharacterized protein n=1 Tax=Nephila pilipes TaxID=299642 RepID=A0A8X6UP93_NEPPI|nr:hypothetical protein NPIL_435091 [Nephila pilipes]
MGCANPSERLKVFKLRHPPRPTIRDDRRSYFSIFDITWKQETVFGNGKCGVGQVYLPAPLSPLPPTPVSSPRPELSFVESVAESSEPCSTESSAASPRPRPFVAEPTFALVVQRGTDHPRRKRSHSKVEKKHSKRSRQMRGKAPADILPEIPGPAIPDLMPKMPGHVIPEPKWQTYVIPESIFVMYPLLGDVSFTRLGQKPVPKSFSTTIGWRFLVAATMAT